VCSLVIACLNAFLINNVKTRFGSKGFLIENHFLSQNIISTRLMQ